MNVVEFSNGIAILKNNKELLMKRVLSYAGKYRHLKSLERSATSTTSVSYGFIKG